MQFLTGIKDIDLSILAKLEDTDLVNTFQTNKRGGRYRKDQQFWLNRILTKFPYLSLDILNSYKGYRSWSDYYIYELRRINPDNSNKYLIDGSRNGRLDHVMVALNNGANVHTENEAGVKWAIERGHLEILKYLVSQGADIHVGDDDLVVWASYGGHLEVVKYLVSRGADIHNDDLAVTFANKKIIWTL